MDKQGSYHKKGLKPMALEVKASLLLLIFIIFGPPLQKIAYILTTENWASFPFNGAGFAALVKYKLWPGLLPAYGQYLPACVIIGAWLRWQRLKGRLLSLAYVIFCSVVILLLLELIIELFVTLLSPVSGFAHNGSLLLMRIIEGLVSGAFCWYLSQKLRLNSP